MKEMPRSTVVVGEIMKDICKSLIWPNIIRIFYWENRMAYMDDHMLCVGCREDGATDNQFIITHLRF